MTATPCPQCASPIRITQPHAVWYECKSETINGHFSPSVTCQSAKLDQLAKSARDLADDLKRVREGMR